jgi:hypothetical protein
MNGKTTTNKIIVGILSCKKNIVRQKSIRKTWLKNLDKNKYEPIFIVGDPKLDKEYILDKDILYVKFCDDYDYCVGKIKKFYSWVSTKSNNKHCWLIDDDCYIDCKIFNKYIPYGDYIGNFIYGFEYTENGGGRASGCAICLSQKAVNVCKNHLAESGVHGDVSIGDVLNNNAKDIIKYHEETIYPWSYCTRIPNLMVGHYIDKGEGSMPTFEQSMDKMHRMYNDKKLKTLVAFKTHVQNEIFRKNLEKIIHDLNDLENFDFVILNHINEQNKNITDYKNIKKINFDKNTSICKKQNYDFWYRAEMPIVHLYQIYPSYDFYYQIEYDCYMNNWQDLLLGLEKDNSDLIGSWLKDQIKEPGWQWWSAQNIFMGQSKLLGMYFPIVRLSNKGCYTLKHSYEYNQELDGFCEVLVPSLLNRSFLKISDMGDILGYLQINHKDEDLLRYKI